MIAKLQETLLKPETLFKKPFIVGGLGLTAGALLWHTVVPSVSDMLGLATWGAIAMGAGAWWLNKRDIKPIDLSPSIPSTITREMVDTALADLQDYIHQFTTAVKETAPAQYQEAIAQLHQRHTQLLDGLERTQMQCMVAGVKGVGKTSLVAGLKPLETRQFGDESLYTIAFVDSGILSQPAEQQALAQQENAPSMVTQLADGTINSDLVIFVSEGDLTATEMSHVQTLLSNGHTLVLAVNKQDRYLPTERLDILTQIRTRLADHLDVENIVPTSAIATRIKVRQHQADGSVVERFDESPADLTALTTQLQTTLTDSPEELIWKTTLRQAHQLRCDVREQWNQVKRDRALPVIEKYQWIAAATAFANPVPTLDLVATGAINAQLLADLGAMYGQPLALDQAKVATRTLAELMVKLGLVELATQSIAPLLKSHVLTFAAGGAAQGLSAAYLTHIAGMSLIQYFEEQTDLTAPNEAAEWNMDRLGEIMQQAVQTYQRGQFLQNLVDQGIKKLANQGQPQSATAAS